MLIEIYSYVAFNNSCNNSGQKSWSFYILHLASRYGPLDLFQVQVMLYKCLFYQVSDIGPFGYCLVSRSDSVCNQHNLYVLLIQPVINSCASDDIENAVFH